MLIIYVNPTNHVTHLVFRLGSSVASGEIYYCVAPPDMWGTHFHVSSVPHLSETCQPRAFLSEVSIYLSNVSRPLLIISEKLLFLFLFPSLLPFSFSFWRSLLILHERTIIIGLERLHHFMIHHSLASKWDAQASK